MKRVMEGEGRGKWVSWGGGTILPLVSLLNAQSERLKNLFNE